MAKGDDAVRKKKNKVNRKRVRNSESAVSARVASVIASKRRRKAGKRRACEGMCFSLPTPDDPFNELHGKKEGSAVPKKQFNKNEPLKKPIRAERPSTSSRTEESRHPGTAAKIKQQQQLNTPSDKDRVLENLPAVKIGNVRLQGGKGEMVGSWSGDATNSKFLVLCLNAIQDSWAEEGTVDRSAHPPLVAGSWGVEFWGHLCDGLNVVDTSGASATREHVAWLVSAAADTFARKEKQGLTVPVPFLLFLVPSQEKAAQVRSVCKPLKALGVHSVSLHPGAPIHHQIHGLKSCQPEFVISTPERLLHLVSLRAIDISGVSLLVLDGIKDLADLGFMDALRSIRENISGYPQVIAFNESSCGASTPFLKDLLKEPARIG